MTEESSAMILGAENEDEDKLSILFLEKEMPLGTRVL